MGPVRRSSGASAGRLRGTDGTGLGPHSARSPVANENPPAGTCPTGVDILDTYLSYLVLAVP